ncbi:MAG: TolC family protein [Candidatus Latescibacterota bacterium]
MQKGFTVLFTCLFFFGVSVRAQTTPDAGTGIGLFSALTGGDTLRINIHDAIFTALENNPTVTIQRLEPDISRTYSKEQVSVFDPQITLSGNKTKSENQRFLGTQRQAVNLKSDNTKYSLGITEFLPTGTTITANTSVTAALSNIYTDQYSGIVGFSITQSLLQGFGTGVNLANLRKANLDVEISKAELRAVAEEIVASVENAYWNVYLSQEEVNIERTSLDLANRQLDESLERVKVGNLPELELAAVRAEVATRKEALIDAESKLEQSRLDFIFYLNPKERSARWSIPVPLERPFVPTDTLDTVVVHEELGLKYRADLQQARYSLKKGELEVVLTKNGLLPKLDFMFSFGRNAYAQTYRSGLPDTNSPFFDMTQNLTLGLPLTNQKARAQYARAKHSRRQMELSVKNMERMVQRDVRSAYIEVLRSKQQITATQVARVLQEKNLDAELEKFRVGKSTNYLVLQAQRDYISSQRDEARSMVSYLNALVNLQLMEGTLLDRRGIASIPEL